MDRGMHPVDLALWEAFVLRLDEESFRPLYEATRGLAYTLCLRLLRHEEDARDAFQTLYGRLLAIARDPELARDVEDVAAFLCLLARREADNLRKRRSRRAAREMPLEEADVMSKDQPAPELLAEQAEVLARIEGLVEGLPDRYRLPVLLHYFHGLSEREVARALGEPASTISDRIRAAIRKLTKASRRAGLANLAATLAGIELTAALAQPAVSAGAVFVSLNRRISARSLRASQRRTSGLGTFRTRSGRSSRFAGGLMVRRVAIGRPGGDRVLDIGAAPAQVRGAKEREDNHFREQRVLYSGAWRPRQEGLKCFLDRGL
jgi:RNA polymerase sigma-70 factor, ECF subfamily